MIQSERGHVLKITDVLCGRGKKCSRHHGNTYLRNLVKACYTYYQHFPEEEKQWVSRQIYNEIHENLNPKGRFLGYDEPTKEWFELEESKALKKISQALRDGKKGEKKRSQDQMVTDRKSCKLMTSQAIYAAKVKMSATVRDIAEHEKEKLRNFSGMWYSVDEYPKSPYNPSNVSETSLPCVTPANEYSYATIEGDAEGKVETYPMPAVRDPAFPADRGLCIVHTTNSTRSVVVDPYHPNTMYVKRYVQAGYNEMVSSTVRKDFPRESVMGMRSPEKAWNTFHSPWTPDTSNGREDSYQSVRASSIISTGSKAQEPTARLDVDTMQILRSQMSDNIFDEGNFGFSDVLSDDLSHFLESSFFM